MAGLSRDPDKARAFQQRGRKSSGEWARRTRSRLAAQSDRVKEAAAERAKVRKVVAARAGWQCQYAVIVPEVACRFYGGRGMEVDELRGGAHRSIEWLNADACRLTCPAHHDVKTDGITIDGVFIGKTEVLRRLAVHEGRTP